jgi:alpha-glucosidase
MGDVPSHLSAMTMVLTYPGVPSIFAGDEIGLEGSWGEDGRRTINWDDRSQWDLNFMGQVQELIQIRKSNDALVNGGLRWVAAEKDFILYLRESKDQSILIFVSRKGVHAKVDISTLGLQVTRTLFGEAVSGSKFSIKTKEATQAIWEVKH